ncbi:hypothetical protein CVT25_001784, partial [Psilocybe cyanescens]
MAAHIGLILHEITAQQQTIRRLDLNPGPLKDSSLLDGLEMCTSVQGFVERSDSSLLDGLEVCTSVQGFVERSVVSLAPAKHGPTQGHPSIKTLTENAQTALDLLGIEVKNINDLYTKELKKRERVTLSAPQVYDSGQHFKPIMQLANSIIQLAAFMVVAIQVILGLSQCGCHWIFQMCNYIMQETAISASQITVPPIIRRLLSKFPRDIRTATSYFNLDVHSTVYATCPKCYEIYSAEMVHDIPVYPERCRARRRPMKQGGPTRSCRELLVCPTQIGKGRINTLIKPYIAFSFHDWMANLVSRRTYEEKMDSAWQRMKSDEHGDIEDIFQATCIKELKGHDKKTHFSKIGDETSGRYLFSLGFDFFNPLRNLTAGHNKKTHFSKISDETSGRYLFSLGFDFFNPLRNLTAGKKVSIGVIALICLNLPINIRYKPENIFLADIIPGPSEPSLDSINPLLWPLVDELLLFWE